MVVMGAVASLALRKPQLGGSLDFLIKGCVGNLGGKLSGTAMMQGMMEGSSKFWK